MQGESAAKSQAGKPADLDDYGTGATLEKPQRKDYQEQLSEIPSGIRNRGNPLNFAYAGALGAWAQHRKRKRKDLRVHQR